MNLYILVEDGKSGHKIMDQWISILLPFLSRAKDVGSVSQNQYILFSGFGYPRILGTNPDSPDKNVLGATIETINDSGRFDYLLIFLDGDHEGTHARKKKVEDKIQGFKEPLSIPYFVFIQNICFETWLLGNQDMMPKNPSPSFSPYEAHYSVFKSDPELMPNNPLSGVSTPSLYHARYLRAMLKEAGHHYNKSKPAPVVMTDYYLKQLKKRTLETPHLKSLTEFFEFMDYLFNQGPHPDAASTL